VSLGQSLPEFLAKQSEIALQPAGTADYDMIGTRHARFRQNFAGKRAKPALHAVANDCTADLLGDSEADTDRGIVIRTWPDKEHETRHGHAPARIRGKEFSAPYETAHDDIAQAESLMRPRARRAASTLRPPTVAVRARKPWRRLRTRLLG
jgi:hypothetical protein